MGRSLSLMAYMAYMRRATGPVPLPEVPRPAGELVWAHATSTLRADALTEIAERLAQLRSGLTMLLTAAPDVTLPERSSRAVIWQPVPEDTMEAAEAFLEHWAPDLCLWTGGDLRPVLLTCADKHDIPLYLADADERLLKPRSWRWFPDLPRSLMSRFVMAMARSDEAAALLGKLGVPESEILVTGPMWQGAVALPYDEDEYETLSRLTRGRPIWLAVHLQLDELDTIIEVHRAVARMAHRALLVVSPDDTTEAPVFMDRLRAENMRVALWSDGEVPEETTQVLLADTSGETGLWYLLAPVTFVGSSLTPGHSGRDPNRPAAHGSAILHGPNVRRYLTGYSRYAEAGAARMVRDTKTLTDAVKQLVAPDQAALMAHAAWDVASQGAEVTDRILDLVQDTLDVAEAG